MPETSYLQEVVILLVTAVIAVSVTHHLRLGAIMGYLLAGLAIGPTGFALIHDLETVRLLAELGVVFLLFTVGLELPLSRIKVILGSSFYLGALQVVATTLVIAAFASWAGFSTPASLVIGGALAFSSTAMVIRILSDTVGLTSQFGRSAFAVLLVQDLAVPVFLVLALALGAGGDSLWGDLGAAGLKLVVAVIAILGFGRIALRHALLQVALIREREIFIALTLAIVLATAFLAHLAGLSMAFGAFLAGMLMAETPYRHQVAADILPFRGLLLGLFFMTIGMAVDLDLAWQNIGLVALLVFTLLFGKALIISLIARLLKVSFVDSIHLGLLLCQGGEFAFVLFAAAVNINLIARAEAQLLILVVAITMLVTPLIARGAQRLAANLERREAVNLETEPPEIEALSGHVVVVGFGRVGRAVAHQLIGQGRELVAVDLDPHRIAQGRDAGFQVYYGDATQPDILLSLHIEKAGAVVVALDNAKAALQVVALARYIFPDLPVFARARSESHGGELVEAGAHLVVPELVQTGVKLAREVLDHTEEDAAE